MKNLRTVLTIVAIIIAIPLLGRLIWSLQKGKKMELMIINKTVPQKSENEVKSLNWVLNFHKIIKANGDSYDYCRDYYGYHPDAITNERKIKSFKLSDISTLNEKYDALFFIDNTGVDLPEGSSHTYLKHYGGFNQNEYVLLKDMKSAGKLVIAEYNFFSEPTEDLVRYNTEQLIDMYSIGWKGKYCKNLNSKKVDENIDSKWIDRYKEYYNENWDFDGPGIILLNKAQNRIIVLSADEFMNESFPSIVTSEEMEEKYHLPGSVPFTGWFEIMYSGQNEVISSLNLNINEKGSEILMRNGLESEFPVVIKSRDSNFILFAGDFSKQKLCLANSKFRIVSDVIHRISHNMDHNPKRFLHTYYEPLLTTIFTNYYDEKQAGD